MLFWAVLGFGLVILLVSFGGSRLSFLFTLLVLLSKSGWLDYIVKTDPSVTETFAAILTAIFILVAAVGGLALDLHDLKHNLRE